MILEWRLETSELAPAVSLVRRFDRVDGAPAEMLWSVTRAAAACLAEPGPQLAFFGNATCHAASSEDLVLRDGSSVLRISADGKRVDIVTDDAGALETTCAVALHLALERQGRFHLHAAALVRSDGLGVLVCGGSGSGKTTAVLSLLDHADHLFWLSDDTVYLCRDDDSLRAVGLPALFHVTERTLVAFPHLRPHARGAVGGNVAKVNVEPNAAYPGRRRGSMRRIQRILFPELGGGATRLEPVSPVDAFTRLLGSSALGLLPLRGRDSHLDALVTLAETSPAARLILGADALSTPSRVNAVVFGGGAD